MSTTSEHRLAAEEALAVALEVLPIFESAEPEDDRPRKALNVLVNWLDDKASVSEARQAAFESHAAARDTQNLAARYAARACGQAASVAHVITHAPHASSYADKSKAELI